ncbi:MAG TPA: type VI secretion system tube protein Hcp [Nitriliruptoraceae bacterium]|nr:type VI secretion system tube protein Hcp [Nitriliruptoraceae bacterium]
MPDLTSHARAAAALPLIDRVSPDAAHTFLKVPDIAGESRHAGHEEEIELFGVEWGFDTADSATAGRGRRRRAPESSDVVVTLATDSSVPYLVQAMVRGKAFHEVVISWVVPGEVQFERQQLTLRNVVVSSVRLASAHSLPAVVAALSYESFVLRYVEQGEDRAAGAEHQVEFDLFANA